MPNHTAHIPPRAILNPVLSRMKKAINTNTDMMTGIPNPPFLMMAPNGAPIKKNIRQERASVNLRIASISCCLMIQSASLVIIDLKSRSDSSCCTVDKASLVTVNFLSLGSLL